MTEKVKYSATVIVWCVIGIILTFIIGFLTGEIKIEGHEKEVDFTVHPINYQSPIDAEKK